VNKPLDLGQFDGHTPGEWSEEYLSLALRHVEKHAVFDEDDDFDGGNEPHYWGKSVDPKLLAAAPALLAELREAREVLGEVQWENTCEGEGFHDGHTQCPSCFRDRPDGHAPDCRLAALLPKEKTDE